jgi:hypothetical protein
MSGTDEGVVSRGLGEAACGQREVGLRILSALFALFAAADLIQLIQATRGEHPDPPGLLLTHAVTGLLAGCATVGLWRGRRWTTVIVLGWGAVTAAMLVALGPVLDEPRETWPGLWLAAAMVAAFSAAAGWYARRRTLGRT